MKTTGLIFRTILLTALAIVILNCKKDVPEPTPPIVNYATFTDSRDGNSYKYIKIGAQEWMAENLTYKTESGSWTYWTSEVDNAKYGRLYSWEAAMQAVPYGWHLPTDAEWKQLEMTLGMNQAEADILGIRGTTEGSKLKTVSGWYEDVNGTDEFGFSALPAGFRSNPGIFLEMKGAGFWWSSSEINDSQAYFRIIFSYSPKIGRGSGFKGEGYSIRCVKD